MDAGEAREQEAVFAFLADPATHGGAAVKRIDTHAAVGVPGRRPRLQGQARGALSLPRLFDPRQAQAGLRSRARGQPRRSRRKSIAAWCRSRASPTAGSRSTAHGTPVEWAVEMRRFDEKRDARPSGGVGRDRRALADALGRAVAAAHANGAAQADAERWIDGARPTTSTSTSRRSARRPSSFRRREVEALARASRAAYARIHPLLRRARAARVSSAAFTAICISAISS